MPSKPAAPEVDHWPERLATLVGAEAVQPPSDSLQRATELGHALAQAQVPLGEVAVAALSLLGTRWRPGATRPTDAVQSVAPIVRQLMEGYAAAMRAAAANSEAQLRASEARYRAIVEEQTDLVCRSRPDGTLTFVNEAYCRSLGRRPAELLGRSFLTLIPEPQRAALRQHLAGFTPEHNVQVNEHPVVRPDDSVGWQQWINRAFFAEDGQLVEFQSVGRDISERKRAEDTLRHEQELMRLLMDNIPDNIYFKDCESRYTRVNQALARFCGCTHPDEVCGKRDGDFYPADMADEFLADERRIFVSGERIIGKIEACAVDPARRRWFSTTKVPLRDAAGAIVGLVGISRDITAQKRVEEELRQHREHLEELVKRRTRELAEVNARLQEELAFTRHVIRGVPAVICRISPDGTTTFINPAGERITGYRAEELTGRNWWRVFYPGEEYRQVEALFAALDRGDVRDHEMVLTSKTGARRTISWNSINRFDAAGQPVEIVGFGNDVTERRQAEDALRESKEFLDKIINSIGDPIFVKDRQHRMVLVNDAECALTGYPREQVLGKTDYEFFPRAQVDVFWENDNAVLETGKENVNEEEITDAHGLTRTIVTKKTRYTDPTGNQFLVGVIRDITDRKRAEVALRTSEANFRTLAETIPVAITITSGSRVLYVNSVAQTLTGYDRQELMGLESYWEVVHPDFRELVLERGVLRERGEAVPSRYKIKLLTKNGDERWVELSVSYLEFYGAPATLATGIDITERKQAEEALRVAQERLELALRGADLGLWDWDVPTGHVIYDERWAQMLGYAVGELEPGYLTWETRVHPDDLPRVKDLLQAHFDGHTPFYEAEHRLRTKTGEWKWILARGQVVVRDERGAPIRCTGTHLDLTERKRAEEAVRQHQEQLTHVARVATVGEMASGLAHELSQPLTAILYFARGCSRSLQAGTRVTAEALDTLQKIAVQAERAGEFVRRLKAFVRKAAPQRVPADLNAIVHEALRFADADVRSKHVAVRLDLAEHLPTVRVDPLQIEQVLLNLIRNAVDAMEQTPTDERVLWICTHAGPRRTVCVGVRDTGAGLTPEVAEHVLDPFFTTKPEGTGLGLAISRTIIEEAHGGSLWVKPDPRGGASAGFALPTRRGSKRVGE